MSDSSRSPSQQTAPSPSSQAALEDVVRLGLAPGIGPRLRRALLDRFGHSTAVLRASVAELKSIARIGDKLAQQVRAAAQSQEAVEILARCEQDKVEILADDDPRYPALLREIYDPPALLFVRGQLHAADAQSVAIVGSRQATHYGKRHAQRLARQLAEAGLTIVSGLARGVDAAAHAGALEAGGRTLAVLGGGVMRIYPPEHEGLAARVAESGALMSETPPWQPPKSSSFPRRNRLITGVSLGVLVIEASERSGALISARHAAEQGREVFALPGPVDSAVSRGCHGLLRDGAKLVESVEDVWEELQALQTLARETTASRSPAKRSTPPLNEREAKVYAAIDPEPTAIDDVAERCGLPMPELLALLSGMEMRQAIRRISGCYVARAF